MYQSKLKRYKRSVYTEARWEKLLPATDFNTIWQVGQTWKQMCCTSITVYNAETNDPLKLKCVTSEMDNTFDSAGADTDVAYYFQALWKNQCFLPKVVTVLLYLSKCKCKQISKHWIYNLSAKYSEDWNISSICNKCCIYQADAQAWSLCLHGAIVSLLYKH